MVDPEDAGTTVLDEDECWRLLARAEVGRLAVSVLDIPEIFPVSYVVDNRRVVFRTAEGTKRASVAISPRVAFEIDGYDKATGEAWSVVIGGTAHLIENLNEVYAAQELPLFPWDPTPKPVFVRIAPTSVSGRRFTAVRAPHEA